MRNPTEIERKVLWQIFVNLKRSETTYKNYLLEGRKFIYAKVLKACNEQLRDLLIEHGYLFSETLQNDAISLIAHYDIWIEKWNDLKSKLNPSLHDEFVFDNAHLFPKDAAVRLEEEFKNMKPIPR